MARNAELSSRNSVDGLSETLVPDIDETSPLLPPAAQDGDAQATSAPSRAFQLRVQLMCAVFLFIIDVSVFIIDPPTQEILEDIICRERYGDPSVLLTKGTGSPCKSPDVQSKLAMFTSVQALTGTLCRKYITALLNLISALPNTHTFSTQSTSGPGTLWPPCRSLRSTACPFSRYRRVDSYGDMEHLYS